MQRSCAGLAAGCYFGALGGGQICKTTRAVRTFGSPLKQLSERGGGEAPAWQAWLLEQLPAVQPAATQASLLCHLPPLVWAVSTGLAGLHPSRHPETQV